MYFNFFDRARSLGGFVRLGNRANEGHAELTVCLYLPDGRVLFSFQRPAITNNDAFDAGGMRFEVVEPASGCARPTRARCSSSRSRARWPTPGAPSARARRSASRSTWCTRRWARSTAPPATATKTGSPPSSSSRKAHYEQHMHVTGTLAIDGETPRDRRLRPARPLLGPALLAGDPLLRVADDELRPRPRRDGVGDPARPRRRASVRRGGVLVRGDEIEPIVDARVEADYDDERPLPPRGARAGAHREGRGARDRRRGHGLHPAAQPARGHA